MFLRLICFFNSWETYFHNLIFHIIAGDSDAESISSRDSSESAISLPSSPEQKRKIKRADTRTASLLVIKNNISTHKSHDILKTISNQGHNNVPVPSQSGVWRKVIKEGKAMEGKIFGKLQNTGYLYCLHFDGKKVQGEEYQVVVLRNPSNEIKLGILRCETGSSKHIYEELRQLINDYNAWKNICMIICDTTAVNTGRLQGVVKLIQDDFMKNGFMKPQYIGCQHHILDLLVKHVMNFLIPEATTKPDLNYSFIDKIVESYIPLQYIYNQGVTVEIEKAENPGWRDDFKFLFELCQAYRNYKNSTQWPRIKWKKLPSLHQARWNSRAIYAVIGYFLLPEWRFTLGSACDFICNEWADAWFRTQHFFETSYSELMSALERTKCEKAIKCLKTHCSVEESIIDIPRSNQIAERAVKLMEELHKKTKNLEYLNLKFIVNNNF